MADRRVTVEGGKYTVVIPDHPPGGYVQPYNLRYGEPWWNSPHPNNLELALALRVLGLEDTLSVFLAYLPPPDIVDAAGVTRTFHDPNAAEHLLRMRDAFNKAMKPAALNAAEEAPKTAAEVKAQMRVAELEAAILELFSEEVPTRRGDVYASVCEHFRKVMPSA